MQKGHFVYSLVILLLIAETSLTAQEINHTSSKFEAGMLTGIQMPGFLNDRPIDLFLPRYYRARPILGFSGRYYPFQHLFLGYKLAYSWEGGGFSNRKTNLNYLDNGLEVGYITNVHRKYAFFAAVSFHYKILITARSINTGNPEGERLESIYGSSYFGYTLLVGIRRNIGQGQALNVCISTQFYSSNLNRLDHHKTRQLLLPSLQLAYTFNLNQII